MVEQYTYEDLQIVPWLGDARLQEFWAGYRLIKSAILDQLPKEEAQIQMFYDKISPSKELQIDLREFDRSADDDPRRTLKFLEDAVVRIIRKKLMVDARVRQKRRLLRGVGADTGITGTDKVAPGAVGKDGGKGKQHSSKQKATYFDGYCAYPSCGKWGHRASECFSNPKSPFYKGKGG